jgi:hypothetical protein
MKGLTPGRIIYYVTHFNKIRPAIVTDVVNKDTGRIELHVFLGHADPPGVVYDPEIGVPGVADYCEQGRRPMTWHWPKKVD